MKYLISAFLLTLAAVNALPAHATPITTTINLDTVYTGNTPDGPAPWLTATFVFTPGSNSVTGWGFYLGDTPTSLNCTMGTCANSVLTSSLNSGPVPGGFNLGFGWKSNNRFDGSDTATYTLTFADMLTSSPFMANESNWFSYAHVQGITNGCSGFIVAGDGTVNNPGGRCGTKPPPSVPEPAGLGMFGLGLLLIGLLAGAGSRWRRI